MVNRGKMKRYYDERIREGNMLVNEIEKNGDRNVERNKKYK